MASRTKSRRLSLDNIFRREVSDKPSESLWIPFQPSTTNDVKEVECECCGLSEDCTEAYIQRIRDRFYGKWVCGLCSEAVTEESYKLGRVHNLIHEEALHAHMEICKKYNETIRANPAMYLAGVMTQILKKGSIQKEELRHTTSRSIFWRDGNVQSMHPLESRK